MKMTEDKHPDGLPFTVPRPVLYLALVAALALAWWGIGKGGHRLVDVADHTDAAQVARGAAVYSRYCAQCHGADLQGEENWQVRKSDGTLPAPPHDMTGHTWHHSDKQNFAYVKYGAASLGDAAAGFKSGMPLFDGTLNDGEIWDVLAFIKSSWPDEIHRSRANH